MRSMPRVFCNDCWELLTPDAAECPRCGSQRPSNPSQPKQPPHGVEACKRTIEQCLGCGIRYLALLGADSIAESCAAARALDGKLIPINRVPSLPLEGCDAVECGCIWTASLGS
jgi:hypothetical protein